MCGIAGAIAVEPGRTVDVQALDDLSRLLARRGPDGDGGWKSQDRSVALVHRRLAIIDLRPTGAQPMSDATGRWRITYNGEIYNYRELRAELVKAGRRFVTNSDTEVLINVIAEWGEGGLRRVRGMFAFALWDQELKELWLARDPYGIKPLYVAEAGGVLWFSSQARPLAHRIPVNTSRDPAALAGFYIWGHIPEPFTWWAGVRAFPAGHVQRLRVGASPGAPSAYYRIEEAFATSPRRPIGQAELRDLIADSVRHHLVADTPVGVFLSAGVDSTVLAALAADAGAPLKTVTLAFHEYRGTAQDEAPLAEATARALGAEHVTVRIDREEFEGLLDSFVEAMDQPTIDGLNTYLVSRATAAQGLKVAISGLGGDELFGGYPSFRDIPRLLSLGKWLGPTRELGRCAHWILGAILPPGVSPKVAGVLNYSGDVGRAYLLRRSMRLFEELEEVMDERRIVEGLEQLATETALIRIVEPIRAAGAPLRSQIAALEGCWYMRNQLLRDTDWASMAHGLEVRVPFVDTTVLERLGPAIGSRQPPTKQDLALCAGKLSLEIGARRKTGFTTPVREWIHSGSTAASRGLRGWSSYVHTKFRAEELGHAYEEATLDRG